MSLPQDGDLEWADEGPKQKESAGSSDRRILEKVLMSVFFTFIGLIVHVIFDTGIIKSVVYTIIGIIAVIIIAYATTYIYMSRPSNRNPQPPVKTQTPDEDTMELEEEP